MTESEKFRDLSLTERQDKLRGMFDITENDVRSLTSGGLDLKTADKLIENSIGVYDLPLGIATNFRINGKDYLIPMVTEEPSVVAGASKAAKIFKEFGGITAFSDEPIALGQIQLILRKDQKVSQVVNIIEKHKEEIVENIDRTVPGLVNRGGGTKSIESRIIKKHDGTSQVILHINIDTKDAMGANITNSVCENIAPLIGKLTKTKIGLRIVSNLADKRLASAKVSISLPREIAKGIINAQVFAEGDIYRAATHNKGVFNGIDAVALATGNDFRAIEAGGHAYAARSGKYLPLTTWNFQNNKLNGKIELPIQVGTRGGLTELHPLTKLSLKILGVNSSKELARVMAAVGLAQNFAALYALVTTGIQKGHMELHGRRRLLAR
jgi:hydroxymethylglutaryl-CoA reductase